MIEKKEIWIFLSHSSEDFERVRQIRNYLEEKSLRPLLFYLKCLESKEETLDLIKREIDVRARFILCDSENAKKSWWVDEEMKYISSKYPPRSYLRIDISQPDDVIHRQLDSYVNQMNIYISCTRNQYGLFNKIRMRLNKYDLNILPDIDSFDCENGYAQEVKKQIAHAANNGYFVFLYSEDVINSSYIAKEFKLADELNANVLLFTLDKESYNMCCNDCSLGKYPHIDVSEHPNEDKADAIANQILYKILPIGGLATFAENFRTGRFGVKDEIEAQKLENYVFEMAEKSNNPYALKFIGECYEYGRLGKPIDLREASMYYSMAIHEPGGPNDESFLKHVRELNEKIYGNTDSLSGFLYKLLSLFKK